MTEQKPSVEDFDTASEWLNFNEGENGERESCHRVAEWLDQLIKRDLERSAAKKAGVPVRKLREVIARRGGNGCSSQSAKDSKHG